VIEESCTDHIAGNQLLNFSDMHDGDQELFAFDCTNQFAGNQVPNFL